MDTNTTQRFEARARIVKALGHATRLIIIDELSRGERCVSDLTALVDSDMSTVSRHLATLVNAGLIAHTRQGNQILYRLRTPCVLNFFDCIERVLDEGAASEEAGACCAAEPRPRQK